MSEWYFQHDGDTSGPINVEVFKKFVANRVITPQTLVRKGTAGKWVPAGRIKGIAFASSSTAIPERIGAISSTYTDGSSRMPRLRLMPGSAGQEKSDGSLERWFQIPHLQLRLISVALTFFFLCVIRMFRDHKSVVVCSLLLLSITFQICATYLLAKRLQRNTKLWMLFSFITQGLLPVISCCSIAVPGGRGYCPPTKVDQSRFLPRSPFVILWFFAVPHLLHVVLLIQDPEQVSHRESGTLTQGAMPVLASDGISDKQSEAKFVLSDGSMNVKVTFPDISGVNGLYQISRVSISSYDSEPGQWRVRKELHNDGPPPWGDTLSKPKSPLGLLGTVGLTDYEFPSSIFPDIKSLEGKFVQVSFELDVVIPESFGTTSFSNKSKKLGRQFRLYVGSKDEYHRHLQMRKEANTQWNDGALIRGFVLGIGLICLYAFRWRFEQKVARWDQHWLTLLEPTKTIWCRTDGPPDDTDNVNLSRDELQRKYGYVEGSRVYEQLH